MNEEQTKDTLETTDVVFKEPDITRSYVSKSPNCQVEIKYGSKWKQVKWNGNTVYRTNDPKEIKGLDELYARYQPQKNLTPGEVIQRAEVNMCCPFKPLEVKQALDDKEIIKVKVGDKIAEISAGDLKKKLNLE